MYNSLTHIFRSDLSPPISYPAFLDIFLKNEYGISMRRCIHERPLQFIEMSACFKSPVIACHLHTGPIPGGLMSSWDVYQVLAQINERLLYHNGMLGCCHGSAMMSTLETIFIPTTNFLELSDKLFFFLFCLKFLLSLGVKSIPSEIVIQCNMFFESH